ncbi:MAG: DUF2089 domain-containing protein [Spirochaetales bacterium]|nr:DUF2089 domain-containing protein [Spirochaetales bacterium]
MNDEQRKILDMLAQGTITADEAEKLLEALKQNDDSSKPLEWNNDLPKYLYIRVDPKEGAPDADQVKITIPLALVQAGINFIAMLPKDTRGDVESAIRDKGIDFDFNRMTPEQTNLLLKALQELVVDVETSENTVRIYAE